MTRLLEPYRVEETVIATHLDRSLVIQGAWILATDKGNYWLRGVPRSLGPMITAHKAVAVKLRRFENTEFVESILSIRKAR